jgi:CubicO group peptidase (beta-lactamase class C family)
VTEPLGIRDTGFGPRDPAALAVPYADGNPEPVRMGDPQRVQFGLGAGILFSPSRVFDSRSFPPGGAGMVGTADDYLVLLETLRTGGGAVLREETVRTMTSNQIGDLVVTLRGPGWGFGFGAAVLKDPQQVGSPQSVGTWEWGGAYGHSWFVDPAQRLTVVALTNTAVEGMSGRFPIDLRNVVYQGLVGAGTQAGCPVAYQHCC